MKKHTYLFILSLFFLNSCRVFIPNRMFKQGNYEYFQVSQDIIDEYIIQKGDVLTLKVYSREGFELIDVLQKSATNYGSSQLRESFLVEKDGFVELPLFGRINVIGYTANELEDIIELKSQKIFNEPFAVLRVTNRSAYIFKGSTASVVSLNEAPTNLLEVIAKSGGIGNDLKAYKIKIIRGDLKNPQIIKVDLSTIEGLRNAELIVQANDIIYIEQRIIIANELIAEITPVLSLVATLTSVVLLVNKSTK